MQWKVVRDDIRSYLYAVCRFKISLSLTIGASITESGEKARRYDFNISADDVKGKEKGAVKLEMSASFGGVSSRPDAVKLAIPFNKNSKDTP